MTEQLLAQFGHISLVNIVCLVSIFQIMLILWIQCNKLVFVIEVNDVKKDEELFIGNLLPMYVHQGYLFISPFIETSV